MWLRRAHPQFFMSLVATICFHAFQASGFLAGPGQFSAVSLKYVNQFAHYQVWALAFGLVACLLLLGLVRRSWWHLARVGLTAGAILCAIRGVLIGVAALEGASGFSGAPTWLFVAFVHIAQAGEPPLNPISARDA